MATRNPLHPSSPGQFKHPHGAQVFFAAWSRAVARAGALKARGEREEAPAERERALLSASGVWGMRVGQWTLAYSMDLLSDARYHRRHGEGA